MGENYTPDHDLNVVLNAVDDKKKSAAISRILAAFDALREERDVAEVHGKKYHARHGHLLPFDGQACLVCRADALAEAVEDAPEKYPLAMEHETDARGIWPRRWQMVCNARDAYRADV